MNELAKRIQSIDILRGLIMALMALDHTRDYFHIDAMTQSPTDLDTTTPILFFTRWITHFCAPTFVFLSGVSIYLQSIRKSKKQLSWFLLTRGLWLVGAELTLVGFGWSFDIYFSFIFLQVIWAIGWSMVILAALVFLNYRVIVATGLFITLFHNVMDYVTITDPELQAAANLLVVTNFSTYTFLDTVQFISAYAILPWTGIMLLGYAAGQWYNITKYSPAQRKKTLLIAGFICLILFMALRLINRYGDLQPWQVQPTMAYTVLSFINVTKYPPSLMYACITLGPALFALAALENTQNRFTAVFNIFGRVPFFYYLLHIYVIHLLCVALYFIQGFTASQLYTLPMAFGFRPLSGFGFTLGYVYLVWLVVLVICYYPCRWYNSYKSKNSKWWLSYI